MEVQLERVVSGEDDDDVDVDRRGGGQGFR